MVYLELLRVRRAFVWYAAALVVICAFIVSGAIVGGNANFDFSDSGPSGTSSTHLHGLPAVITVPIEALIAIAAFCALGFGTALAGSFNRDTQNAHFLFVRPLSRYKMAGLTAGVDVASIACAGLVALALAFLTTTLALRSHAHYNLGPNSAGIFFLGFGTSIMWYGVLQALSAWTSRRGGVFVGVGSAVLGFAIPLSQQSFLGPIQYLFKAILYIDPLAYFASVTIASSGDVSVGAHFASAIAIRALTVWILAAVAIGISAFCWKRVEI